jgi:hypothetical protein
MWAAYIALANEQAAKNKGTIAGFINPAIYTQNSSDATSYSANFNDVIGGVSGSYEAVAGYDLVTGWGSPKLALIDALVNQKPSLSASPGSVTLAPGTTATTTIIVNGSCSGSSLSADPPSGFSVSFSPASITGSGTSQLTIAAGSSVSAGTYEIPVTDGDSTCSVNVNATVTTTTTAPAMNLSVNPSSATVNRGSSTQAILTLSGSNSRFALSTSGVPPGVTVRFSSSSISGSKPTDTMTVTVGGGVPSATYPVTITAASGGTTLSTSFQLTVS